MNFVHRLLFLTVCFFSFHLNAVFQTPVKQAILIDLTTGTILYEKNSNELAPPSSMSKIMTVYTVFTEIKKGRLSLEDRLTVSKKAWRMGGSRMFIDVNSQVSVHDLLKGVIVQSGNDAAVCLAEGISGSEEAFVQLMSDMAQGIGVKTPLFANSTGMPDPNHLMTMRDIAVIATRTMMDHPDLYPLYKEKEFTYNNIRQQNRNPLIHDAEMGCDGLKTGHTDAGGYGLVASTVQNGRRLLMVVNGAATKRERAVESKRLINYGYRAFTSANLFSAGEFVGMADVWMGSKDEIPLMTTSNIAITVPRALQKDVKAEVVYKGPLEAPIKVGDEVAKIIVTIPGKDAREYPLVAGESVEKRGFFSRLGATVNYLVFGGAPSKKEKGDSTADDAKKNRIKP